MTEIWKDINGYEGLYQISNLGNIKSLARKTKNQYCKSDSIMEKRLSKNGYYRIGLFKNKHQKHFAIHRLVAEAFIPNPSNLPCVNHKDEIKTNNVVDNLEWCTVEYNNTYGNRVKNMCKSKEKKIIQYDLNGNVVKIWSSQKEAIEKLNISNHITDVCNNKRNSCGGYKWEFLNEKVVI